MNNGPRLTRRSVLTGLSATALLLQRVANARVAADQATRNKIEALIARMTPQEKAGQLSLYADTTRTTSNTVLNPVLHEEQVADLLTRIRAGAVTGLFQGVGIEGGRRLQRVAVEESRLKIPLIFGADVIHGLRTVFPIPLGEAASFEPALAEKTARAAAVEATATGIHWTFAPMVDVARDQRWGRVAEGAGEDTYLGQLFARARVKGFQGRSLTDEDSLLACPKHFAAYGAVTGGMEYNTVEMSDQTLREVHLPPFRAAFDAGALSTMSAFNDINGIPATADGKLLSGILRKEWGFRGLVVSDYGADLDLIEHGVAADEQEAARLALMAGVDISMQSGLYYKHLPKLVASGRVPMKTLDAAVRRVLYVKHALGLFDNPYRSMDPERERTQMHTAETHALARECGRRSIVLLKNEQNVLPLPKSGKRIALIGPLGANTGDLDGCWSPFSDRRGVSLEAGLRAALADPSVLTVVQGSNIDTALEGGIDAAVAAARAADVVLLAIGESQDMSGEAQSRTTVSIPPAQQQLAEAVGAVGKPVVVVLRNGRAIGLTGAVRAAPAILVTWFLGSETGNSIADVVFGDYNPSGRLPVSFPQDPGQQPFYYNHRATGRPQKRPEEREYKARYREVTNAPLYPFGHGLTYSEIVYDKTSLSSAVMAWNGSIIARTRVSNKSPRSAEEVVQLYVQDRVASATRPVLELKGIRKVIVPAGGSVEVAFTLTRKDLEFVGRDLLFAAEAGEFGVWVGPSSAVGTMESFTLGRASS